MIALGKNLNNIKKHVLGTWCRELDGPVQYVQPGNYVYIKSLAEKNLEPQWEGSFQVLLTSFTAIKIREQAAWIHHTRIKKASQSPWRIKQVQPGKVCLS